MEEKEIFVVGKIHLNPDKKDGIFPFLEIMMDTAPGRSDGELILLKQIGWSHY